MTIIVEGKIKQAKQKQINKSKENKNTVRERRKMFMKIKIYLLCDENTLEIGKESPWLSHVSKFSARKTRGDD